MESRSFREVKRELAPKLVHEGVPRVDALFALTLTEYIRWFDVQIFGAKDYAPIIIQHEPEDFLAECHQLTDGTYRYIVHAYAIVRRVRRDVRKTQFFISRATGNLQIVPAGVAHPRIREFLIAVAAHEVRHRLQMVGVLPRMFSPSLESAPSGGLIRFLWQIERVRHAISIHNAIAEGLHPRAIASAASAGEFDARLVEQVVMHRICACETEEDLVDLVLTEPETTERRA
ncbi:MAG: hypothetical protein IT406_01320 [Candidatus Yanofskybacteria bacterium]|nr:hypothetical protein [Candidatus Yanofskybacteria bacterium]